MLERATQVEPVRPAPQRLLVVDALRGARLVTLGLTLAALRC